MPGILIFIILSLSFYMFYKIKYFRSKRPIERSFLSSKSGISLGLFVALFGINQYFIHQTTISLVIGIIFLVVGLWSILAGYRTYKYFYPLVIEEAKELKM